jgi:cytochrome c nitrite reductase small subunit
MTSTPALVLGTLLGIATGIGGYTFIYARGGSYLTNDPAACVNCHVMREQFDGWVAGSHRAVAVCNDCHTPPGYLAKYTTKALNGFWHSFAFTSGRFPDPITITARNRRVTEQACRKCHAAITEAIESPVHGLEETACLRCHAEVGHR